MGIHAGPMLLGRIGYGEAWAMPSTSRWQAGCSAGARSKATGAPAHRVVVLYAEEDMRDARPTPEAIRKRWAQAAPKQD